MKYRFVLSVFLVFGINLFAQEAESQQSFRFNSAPQVESNVTYVEEEETLTDTKSYIPIPTEAKQGIYWGVKTPSWTLATLYFMAELISPSLSEVQRNSLDPLFDFYRCHEWRSRSFIYSNGIQMPLCARCTGMSIGIWAGHFDSFIWDSFQIKDWERWEQGLLHIGVYSFLTLPMIIDGFVQKNSYTYLSTNPRRLITGFFFGYAMTAMTDELLQLILDYEGDVPQKKRREQ